MLFSLTCHLKPGAEERLIEFHDDFNEHLTRSDLVMAAVLRDASRRRVAYTAFVEADSLDEARSFLDDSPYDRAGLCEPVQILECQIEVGGLARTS